MSERKIRVGQLIRQFLSEALHERWRSESVAITITDVDAAPDLRSAHVYFSVIGDRTQAARATKFLLSIRNELRFMLGRNVTLKYTPSLNFIYDPSIARGMRIEHLLDELDAEHPESAAGAADEYEGNLDAEESVEEGEE